MSTDNTRPIPQDHADKGDVKRYTGAEVEADSEHDYPKWIHAADYAALLASKQALEGELASETKELEEYRQGYYAKLKENAALSAKMQALEEGLARGTKAIITLGAWDTFWQAYQNESDLAHLDSLPTKEKL